MSLKKIKKRITAVNNIAKITKAMEAVAAAKMRKSQLFALSSRPYAVAGLELLMNLLERTKKLPPLLKTRPVKNSLLIIVTSDKGLAGSFNANVLKRARQWISDKQSLNEKFTLMALGKKGIDFLKRQRLNIEKIFIGAGDFIDINDTLPISEAVIEGFLKSKWDAVYACYTNFRTTLKQEVVLNQILPASQKRIKSAVESILPEYGRYSELKEKNKPAYRYEYLFEPSPDQILQTLVPQLIKMHIHHIILESNASEHSSRMVAMKNASKNAQDLKYDLTLSFNRLRQESITKELIEISLGSVA